MGIVPRHSQVRKFLMKKKTIRNPGPGWGAIRSALDRTTGSRRYFNCVRVLKCQGVHVPGARKEPAVSIALDEYVLTTMSYPDVQKVALGFENDHIRDHPSQFFFVSQIGNWW